jgi:hypothetical protein
MQFFAAASIAGQMSGAGFSLRMSVEARLPLLQPKPTGGSLRHLYP